MSIAGVIQAGMHDYAFFTLIFELFRMKFQYFFITNTPFRPGIGTMTLKLLYKYVSERKMSSCSQNLKLNRTFCTILVKKCEIYVFLYYFWIKTNSF